MVNPMINSTRETSMRMMPHSVPGVPGKIAWGGYSVQPAPDAPPGTKKHAVSTSTAAR